MARSCSIACLTKSVVVTGAAATAVAADQASSRSIRGSMARDPTGNLAIAAGLSSACHPSC